MENHPDFAYKNDFGNPAVCDVQIYRTNGQVIAVVTDPGVNLEVANSMVEIMNKVWTRLRVRPDVIYEHSHDGTPKEQWYLVALKWRGAIKTYEAPKFTTASRAEVEAAIGQPFIYPR